MNSNVAVRLLATAIAGATVLAGATQVLVPGFVLGVLSAQVNPTSTHFFAIVGMFMVLFGGLTLQALRLPPSEARLPLLWSAFQKFGASAAVALGVYNDVFSALALAVAAFDFFSGLVLLRCRRGFL